MQFVSIGFANLVSATRVIAILTPESAPIKRLVHDAKENGNAIDSTCGRKTRAVLIMDSGHIIMSSVQPETMAQRSMKEAREEF